MSAATIPRRPRAVVCVAFLVSLATVAASFQHASASPTGFNGEIAFMRQVAGGGGPQLKTVNPDGSGEAVLKDGVGVFTHSCDGSRIAYFGETGISIMNADGTAPHAVLPGEGDGFRLSWTCDGSQFMFQGDDATGEEAIVIINADGTDRHLILDDNDSGEWYPAWSPAGDKVVYSSEDGANTEGVWIADADGTNARLIAPSAIGPSRPAFSADGTKVVFGARLPSEPLSATNPYRIHVANVDGSGLHAVGPAENCDHPTFSPDGGWIALACEALNDGSGIFVMRTDGSGLQQLTHGRDNFPSWQSLAEAPNVAPRSVGTAKEKFPLWVFGNAEASYDTDGSIVSYEWRWGDYTPVTPRKYAWHRYSKPGTYLIRLTVTDNDGARTTRQAWFHVTG